MESWTDPDGALGIIIDGLLGKGLNDAQWKSELEARGWTWNGHLRNTVIHKEFVYFIPEIMRLLAEPNIAQGASSAKSNSRASIHKRLRGEIWVEGVPDEKAERERTRRLYGNLARTRCFQEKVKKHLDETASDSQISSPAEEGLANVSIHETRSIIEDVSGEQMNPLAPVRISAAISGQTPASPAATNNEIGYAVLIRNRSPSSTIFPHTHIHDSVYRNENKGTSSGLNHDWSVAVDCGTEFVKTHSAQLQTSSTSPSSTCTQEGIQLFMNSAYLESGIVVHYESPASSIQQNKAALDIDIDHFVDYNAYNQAVRVKDDAIGDGLHDEEMQTEPHKTSDFHRMGLNSLLPSWPSESVMSFDSENTAAAIEKAPFDEQLEDSNLYNTLSGSLRGNALSLSKTSSNTQSAFPSTHNANQIPNINIDEAFTHQSSKDNSCPGSDTEMESPFTIQFPTRRVLRVGRKEKRKRALLRKIVLSQREQLKARNAENLKLKDIMKKVQVLQISNKQASEEMVQRNTIANMVLQRAIDDEQGHITAESSRLSPPKGVLPWRRTPAAGTPAGASHSREKSTVSSSAGTATTSSSVSSNPKELKERIGHLEGKMKAILKTMKKAKHDSGYGSLKLGESPRGSASFEI